jgi:predicted transcriptional regulator
VNNITNPLWFFAKTTVYPEFLSRLAALPPDKQKKILKNIKKNNQFKYKQLAKELGIRN